EQGLWKQAGIEPRGAWYIESGQGMGQTLGIANDRRAYILSDRGTWLAFQRRVSLPILSEKDMLLLNIYSVMEVNPSNGPRVNAAGGKAFAEFMLAPETQAVIRTFGVGMLGGLELLYTPTAMILAQLVIAAPIVTGLTLAAIQQVPERFRLQLLALGASRAQLVWTLIKEARLPMLAAVMAGFGAVISEVGASLMVGGNIKGSTRVLTTATVLETGK